MDRDFKGVWIPKEIWLNKDLTLLEKIIFTEIDSLDNEDNCTAGNEYFAEFCGCSESKVSKAIKKLQDLDMIEVISFDGRHRKLRVAKNAMQSSKKCYADSQKVLPNNIVNNTINKTISKDIVDDTTFSEPKKSKKKNLYEKCTEMVDEYTNNMDLQNYLKSFLIICLENSRESGRPFYANMWKSKLTKLSELSDNTDTQIKIVKQTLDNGWSNFYEYKGDKKKSGRYTVDEPTDMGYTVDRASKRRGVIDGEKF